jgi:hypothetical protein
VAIQEIFDTGIYETVYNLRVSNEHTYFVGDDSWGWTAWAHNLCYNIALGTFQGLATFAKKYDAKYYLQWEGEDFGREESWNPADLTGGTTSNFATAVRHGIVESPKIFFKVDGFNIQEFASRIKLIGDKGEFQNGSLTAWELKQLVLVDSFSSQRKKMSFVSAGKILGFTEFNQVVIDTYEAMAKNEKQNIPNWESNISGTVAIAFLMNEYDYTIEKIRGL